jgi:hypothetical protein
MAQIDEGPPRPVTPTIGGETIELSMHSDITLSVSSTKDESGKRRLVHFKLEAKALTTNSEYFSASLRFNSANGHQTLSLKDDNIDAMYIWLLYMQVAKENEAATDHDEPQTHAKRRRLDTHHSQSHTSQESLFAHPIVKDTSIDTIWHIINAADKYLLDATILRGFFDRWYTKNVNIRFLDADLARQVALPCYMFDHASGFADVTKWLAYHHEGHITEKRPDGFKFEHMRLAPPDFVGRSHSLSLCRLAVDRYAVLMSDNRSNEPRSRLPAHIYPSRDLGRDRVLAKTRRVCVYMWRVGEHGGALLCRARRYGRLSA